jgi:hypothetical protein
MYAAFYYFKGDNSTFLYEYVSVKLCKLRNMKLLLENLPVKVKKTGVACFLWSKYFLTVSPKFLMFCIIRPCVYFVIVSIEEIRHAEIPRVFIIIVRNCYSSNISFNMLEDFWRVNWTCWPQHSAAIILVDSQFGLHAWMSRTSLFFDRPRIIRIKFQLLFM